MSTTLEPFAPGTGAAAPLRSFVEDEFLRVLRPVNLIFGAYLVALTAIAVVCWRSGEGGPRSVLAFAAFFLVNRAFGRLSLRPALRTRVELARIAAAAVLAPAAYLLAGEPFMRWWPGFLIMCLGGSIFVSLKTGSPRLARALVAYYVALLVGTEAIAPAPHDWFMLGINAGAVAIVGLLVAELVALLGMALASERERRLQLADEKARSETMLQREAAEALRASEEHFRSLIDNAFDITVLIDREGRYRYVSGSMERTLGWTAAELSGREFGSLTCPDDTAMVRAAFEAAFARPGEAVRPEFRVRHRNGSWRTLEAAGKVRSDGLFVANIRDVTDRKRVENAFRALVAGTAANGADIFETLVRHVAEALRVRHAFVAETVGEPPRGVRTLAFWSGTALAPNLEYPLPGTPCERVVAGDLCYFPSGIQASFPTDADLAVLQAESYFGIPLRDAAGRVLGHLAVLDDKPMLDDPRREALLRIFAARAGAELERQRADARLRAQEESLRRLNAELEQRIAERTAQFEEVSAEQRRLARIIEATSDYVGIADLEGHAIYVNRAGRELVGLAAEEPVRGRPVSHCYPDEHAPRVREMIDTALGGAVWSGAMDLVHRSGHVIPVSEVTFTLPDAQGRPEYLATIIRDVTASRRAEDALRESEERFRMLVDNAPEAIIVLDADTGRFVDVSASALRLFGLSREALFRLGPVDLSPAIQPDGRSSAEGAGERIARALDGETVVFEWTHLDGDGREVPCEIRLVRLPSSTRRLIRATLTDIRARKAAEAELTKAKEAAEGALAESRRLTAILESTSDFVGIADPAGHVLYINGAGRRMLGIREDEDVRALDFERVFTAQTARRIFEEGVPGALAAGSWAAEVDFRHRDGTVIPTSFVGIVHRAPDGAPARLSCIARDISERKRAEGELKQAKEAAEAASRAKSTFLASMSHEIRTPMNAVIGMTSLLLDTPLSPRQRYFVETVRSSGDSLLNVINDILDFSKIEAEKLAIVQRPFVVRESVEEVLDLLAARAAEKKLEIAYLADPDVPVGVLGDVTRVRQILVNLVGNAIKFTDRGEVVVSVASRRLPDAGAEGPPVHELRFSVRDTGRGIPPGKAGKLFESFSQIDSSYTRDHGGTGLGLAISRRLAEIMGGRIWVESSGEPGQGSEFHFTILAEEADASICVRRDHQALPELRGKRVLVVDDNATNRRILTLQARAWGMETVEAENAAEALARIRSDRRFDLALLDMHLPAPPGQPAMDGVQLAAKLCAMNGRRRLPLVMLTSLDNAQRAEVEAIDCFEAWLTKPVKPSQVYDVIVHALAPHAEAAPVAPAAREALLAESLPLRILLAEDVAVNQKFVLLALEQMGYRADVAGNGREAVSAVERQPYDVVFMDVQMPEMDGLEATRRIRALLPMERQPYITAMTANAMQGDREVCLEAGMDDYVSKPVYLSALRSALERAGERMRRGIAEPAGAAPAQGAPALSSRPAAGEELHHLYLQGAQGFVEDLRGALRRRDADALTRAAHALKGSSGYVGADALAALCADIERAGRSGSLDQAASLVEAAAGELDRVRRTLPRPAMMFP